MGPKIDWGKIPIVNVPFCSSYAIHKQEEMTHIYYFAPHETHTCFSNECEVQMGSEACVNVFNVGFESPEREDISSFWIMYVNKENKDRVTISFASCDGKKALEEFQHRVFTLTGLKDYSRERCETSTDILLLCASPSSYAITLFPLKF